MERYRIRYFIDGVLEIKGTGYYESLIHCHWGWEGRSDGWYKAPIHNSPIGQPYDFSSGNRYYSAYPMSIKHTDIRLRIIILIHFLIGQSLPLKD